MSDMNAGILEEIEDQNLFVASGDNPPSVSIITICGPTMSPVCDGGVISLATVVTCASCK
ncbi:hypothetical protein [Nocardiopsis aegyptia]|uniref:Uncharacterized protein n=1 Tax=Nocardiopsis aegyptia TaxID=220378 RepID=A0A7Z0JBM2_9ACTN|nr:hypothetical protein [Nocardiopsis aegyptia]NYJ35610.1 hypothetical protein [Nocardiopsis aegyptia]